MQKQVHYLFIFDLHNTLVKDNDLTVMNAMNSVLAERGSNVRVDIEYVRNYQAALKPFAEYFRAIMPAEPLHEIEQMMLATKEICEKVLIKQYVKEMDGAEEVLQQIKKNGDDIFVLSFSTITSIDIYLQVTGLSKYIDKRLGIESIQEIQRDGDPAKVKSKLLEDNLKTSSGKYDRVFMIGDSVSDMKAGKSVGATNIYFTKTREVLDVAHYSIDKLHDIIKIAYSS